MVGQYVLLERRRDFFFITDLPSCLDGLPVDCEWEGCFRSVAQGMRQTYQVHGVYCRSCGGAIARSMQSRLCWITTKSAG
jgi:hypothetical protein